MNGPQQTACLAKGYANSKYKWTLPFNRGSGTTDSIGYVTDIILSRHCQHCQQQVSYFLGSRQEQKLRVKTAAETARAAGTAKSPIGNMQELCTPPPPKQGGGHDR